MKQIYFLAIAIFGCVGLTQAQFTDDIESYSLGPVFEGPWTTWDGTNDGVQNATVTDERAVSGTQSIFIGSSTEGQDAILDLGGVASTGVWSLQFMMYIPSGNSGYMNLQGNIDPNANANQQFMSGNITFNSGNATPGEGADDNGSGPKTFTFPHDEWFTVGIEVDTDGETYNLFIAGTEVGTTTYSGAADRFDGVDFFAADEENSYFIDDVIFSEGPFLSTGDLSAENFKLFPNPAQDRITINTETIVDEVRVIDILGRVIIQRNTVQSNPSLDIAQLAAGTYIVQVRAGNSVQATKLIKQ